MAASKLKELKNLLGNLNDEEIESVFRIINKPKTTNAAETTAFIDIDDIDDDIPLPDIDFNFPTSGRGPASRDVYYDDDNEGAERSRKRPRATLDSYGTTPSIFDVAHDPYVTTPSSSKSTSLNSSRGGRSSKSTSPTSSRGGGLAASIWSSNSSISPSSPIPSSPPETSSQGVVSVRGGKPPPRYQGSYEAVSVPMKSQKKKFKSGKYTGQNFLPAIADMCSNDPDYVLFLWHSGVLQKGHDNCDPDVVDAIGNHETLNPQDIQSYGRLLPATEFFICFGETQTGKTMAELPGDYATSMAENNVMKRAHPWFVEAYYLACKEGRFGNIKKGNMQKRCPDKKQRPIKSWYRKSTHPFKKDEAHQNAAKEANGGNKPAIQVGKSDQETEKNKGGNIPGGDVLRLPGDATV
ncbi:uncharacterized protein K460DRAFT_402444 [Cucurbitaria berberidis CBS 394.84]|uniref:Uncharacterized protein n=1 Tax=Cucurbitaria berberidis CBS 394.84 TaxID=1168544 RepID=A0A9P4GIZ9_9PLEO|nr:uncharacterized protein K460DRAFT_402444 [Cucurbitaria berberidis CBS 394.84]KAF1847078.1 hypothetical protein K460DRAFT_402444 [Cucurbitaria berberidis CBS 394.84]